MLKLKKIIFCAVFAMFASNVSPMMQGAGAVSGTDYSEAPFGDREGCSFRSLSDATIRFLFIEPEYTLSDLEDRLFDKFGKNRDTHSLRIILDGRTVVGIRQLAGCSTVAKVNLSFTPR
jgi:hypothetical protein